MPSAEKLRLPALAGLLSRSAPSADASEIDAGGLQTILTSGALALLRLPASLENSFREHYRVHAATILRLSIYGLIGLYLLVVLPVQVLLAPTPEKSFWLKWAVYPIGLVLAVLWINTRFSSLKNYVEQALGVSLCTCMAGTIYCSLRMGEQFFGHVAAYETIFIIIVAFSFLRISTSLAMAWSLIGFLAALIGAHEALASISWLQVMLFFMVPLLICSISGLMLEYAARRDFIQTLYHQQEKSTVLRDIAAASNQTEDINVLLEQALKLLCVNRSWLAGQAYTSDKDDQGLRTAVLHISAAAGGSWFRAFERWQRSGIRTTLAQQALESGEIAWTDQSTTLSEVKGPQGQINMRVAVPIKLGAEVVVVLEFFSGRAEPLEQRLQMLLEQVAHQLGQVFERHRRHQQLLNRATHDPLTGLPNRGYLLERITAVLARVHRQRTNFFAVLLMDVDRFKWINDSLGHELADRLLVELSQRLRRALRPSDTVARLGSDQFVILMEDVDDTGGAISVATRTQEELNTPLRIEGHQINLSASIGIALGNAEYQRAEDLLRDADTAMYHAKQRGRGGYVLFSPTMSRQHVDRLRLMNELQDGIEGDQLVLYYQPIVRLSDCSVAGFEALVRWQHPRQGLLNPDEFIPVAEDSSLIIPLTRRLLQQACRQLRRWQEEFPEATGLTISVNMCSAFFALSSMPEEVTGMVASYGVRPECLRLEITETQVMSSMEACMHNIVRLREHGILVYVDDFGTGYSSLNYLASFNAKSLKIDRSFVTKGSEHERAAVIIRAISVLGHHLNMDVIAEGVETPAQLQMLLEIGVDYGQGYYFARPLPAAAAAGLIGKTLPLGAPPPAENFQASFSYTENH